MLLIALGFFVLLGGAVIVLAAQNFLTEVQLSLLGWQTPYIPVGMLLLAAFLLGVLVLYMISVASATQEKREIHRLRDRIKELEQAQAVGTLSVFHSLASPEPLTVVSTETPGQRPSASSIVPIPGITAHIQPAPSSSAQQE